MLWLLAGCFPAQTFQPEDIGRRAVLNDLEHDASHCPFGQGVLCTPGPLLDGAIADAVRAHDAGDGRIPLEQRERFVQTVRERYQARWDGLQGIPPIRARLEQLHANPPLRHDGWRCVVDIGPQPGRLVLDDGHLVIQDPHLPAPLIDRAIHKAEAADPPCGTLEIHSVVTNIDRGRLVVKPDVLPLRTTFVPDEATPGD